MIPDWLMWVRELQAIAQNGLTYTRDPYDRERYEQLQRVAAEIAAAATSDEYIPIHHLFTQETGHATPKLDVRGLVLEEGHVLLVKELADGGLWTLPGGWIEVGESPREAVEKEVREESGYVVRATRLLAVWDRDRHGHPPHPAHIYKLMFLCERVGGAAADSLETQGASFFPLTALPPLSLSRITPQQINRLIQLARQINCPTEFD
jgi:ADP-ribose pyrophosphatase YjhB (NUDIX family)